MAKLCVVLPGVLPVGGSRAVAFDPKTMSGLAQLSAHWDDDIVVASIGGSAAAAGPTDQWFDPADLPFEISVGESLVRVVGSARPDLILSLLIPATSSLVTFAHKLVLVLEFTPEDLTHHELGSVSRLASLRVRAGGLRRRTVMEALVREVRGIQCNGYPSFERFAPLARSALLFFDSRVTTEQTDVAQRLERSAPSSAPRLCFSGRLIEAKGPLHAVEAVRLLRARGMPATLDFLGTGPQSTQIEALGVEGVRLLGHKDYPDEWVPHVREHIDMMLLPHVQGDPSGTYIEAAAAGIPIVGFNNVALESLVTRHGLGWTAPLGDASALADAVSSATRDHPGWWQARAHALSFASSHAVESEYARRIEHLRTLL